MGNVKEPILTEKTGIRIAEAIELSNAYAREQTSHMAQQTAFMKEISSRIGGDDVYFVTAIYADESYALVSDVQEVVSAYAAGKKLVLSIVYDGAKAYICAMNEALLQNGALKGFRFASSNVRPVGDAGAFTLLPSGALSASTSTPPTDPQDMLLYLGDGDYYTIESKLKFALAVLGSARAASILAELGEVGT